MTFRTPHWPALDVGLGKAIGGIENVIWPGMKQKDQPHAYICGSTGAGKSKLLEHIVWEHLRTWTQHRCPLVLIDPHGGIWLNILRRLARSCVTHLPIIPIDFRRNDIVVSYNPMRFRPDFDPAVPVGEFVQMISFIFDAPGTNATPRFEKWGSAVFHGIYANKLSLYTSRFLLDSSLRAKPLRAAIARSLGNHPKAANWWEAEAMSQPVFADQFDSTGSRFQRFVDSEIMRLVFGTPHVSLDFDEILREGHIVLINLATQGGQLRDLDAGVVGGVVMADLWDAARRREKHSGKPCRVVIDECQNFVTPVMAKGLAQARGFGLWLYLANQFPQQFLHEGASGEAVLDNVIVNAVCKIVFRLGGTRYTREIIEDVFGSVMNPELLKRVDYSTKVLAYNEQTRTIRSRSRTEGEAESEQWAQVHTESDGVISSPNGDDTLTSTVGVACTQGGASNRYWARAAGESVVPVFLPEFGKEVSGAQFWPLEEQFWRCMRVLADQDQRECVVRLPGMRMPIRLFTPEVPDVRCSDKYLRDYINHLISRWPFFQTREAALKSLEEEQERVVLLARGSRAEPTSARGPAVARKK